jgi:hypothetical protein
MVGKAQKSQEARSELNLVFGLEEVDRWNPIRTSAIQSRSRPMRLMLRGGVRVLAGAGNFSLHHRVQTGSGATQPPIQWVPGAVSLGLKRPGREADHSPPSSAKFRNSWSYTSTLPIQWRGAQLKAGYFVKYTLYL